VFWGSGNAASLPAGEMNASGRYYVLLPPTVASRLVPAD